MSSILGERVFVVAEAGVQNYGKLELALRQVDAAADAGADAVKFQAWRTEALVSRPAAAAHAEALGVDWYERMAERELSWEELREVQAHAQRRGIAFFASAHDPPSLRFLVDELDVPFLKVGSGEASNWDFLERVGHARRPVFVAFGLQSDEEARRAVETLAAAGAPEIIAFHARTVYPTPASLADLRRLARLRELLRVPVGLSDHTVGSQIALAAVAMGARAIEKHLTFDKADPRSQDNPGALEPAEWIDFVRAIREIEAALQEVDRDELERALATAREWALQAIVAARDLAAGAVLEREDVALKRPLRGGIAAGELERVLGRTLIRPVTENAQIRPGDLR